MNTSVNKQTMKDILCVVSVYEVLIKAGSANIMGQEHTDTSGFVIFLSLDIPRIPTKESRRMMNFEFLAELEGVSSHL